MQIYGHRGASATEPENTLRAFNRAIEVGAAGIEFDVQVTADRIPVVLHDRDLIRTTGIATAVDCLTLADLRALDAGHGECVPTLAETLDLVGDRLHLDIEIKQGGIEPEVLAVLADHPAPRWAISSFDWTSLERVRALAPPAELWALAVTVSEAVLEVAARLGATAVSLYDHAYTEGSAQLLRSAGLNAVIWTVNDSARADIVRDLGAYAICTDDPAAMLASLER